MQMNEATLFGHAKVRDLSGSTDDMNRTLERLGACSSESDLAVNVAKKKMDASLYSSVFSLSFFARKTKLH